MSESREKRQKADDEALDDDGNPNNLEASDLRALLNDWKAAKAHEWSTVLAAHEIETMQDLDLLFRNKIGWDNFISTLNTKQFMLASHLLAWKRGRDQQEQHVQPSGGPPLSFFSPFFLFFLSFFPAALGSSPRATLFLEHGWPLHGVRSVFFSLSSSFCFSRSCRGRFAGGAQCMDCLSR